MNMHDIFFERAGGSVTPQELAETIGMSALTWLDMQELDQQSVVGQACLALMRHASSYENLMIDTFSEGRPVDWVNVYRQMQVFLFG